MDSFTEVWLQVPFPPAFAVLLAAKFLLPSITQEQDFSYLHKDANPQRPFFRTQLGAQSN